MNQPINQTKEWIVNRCALLLEYLVPIFYFSITVAFYLRTYDSAQIKITILQIVGIVVIAIWLIKLIYENANPFKDNILFTGPLLIYLGLAYFSFYHSDFPGTTLDEFIRRNVYQIFTLILIKEYSTELKIKRLINWVLVAAFISSFYGIVQYLDYVFFPKAGDMMMRQEALDPFIWRQAFGSRIFSTHGNPNFFGNFLVVVSPIILALFLWKKTANYLLLFLMVVFCIYHTGSKGAYLGFVAGLFIFSVLTLAYFPIGRIKVVKNIFIIGTMLAIMLSGFFVYKKSMQRIASLDFRIFTWLSTFEMIERHPVMGAGLGTFKTTYPAFRRPEIFHIEGKSNTETDHPENEFIEVLYDDGILGFGLFLWVLSVITVMGLKSLKRFTSSMDIITTKAGKTYQAVHEPRAYYMLGFLSAFFGMLFHNLFDVSLRFVSSGIFLWMLIGLIASLTYNNPLGEKNDLFPLKKNHNELLSGNYIWLQNMFAIAVIATAGYFINIFWGYFKADMHHNQGIFFSKQQRWPQALEHYNNVIRLNPNYIMAHYFMGNVYNDRWQEGDWERALRKYDDVKKLAPNYVQVHHQTGNVYTKLGDTAMNQARSLMDAGNQSEAQKEQQKAVEYYNLALESYNKYWKLDPVFPQNFYRMAWVYMQLGDRSKAEEMYRAALVHNPDYAETHLNLGNILYLQDKLNEAETAYLRAIELNPRFVQAMKNLSVVYDNTGRKKEAEDLWREIARINPNDEDLKRVLRQN